VREDEDTEEEGPTVTTLASGIWLAG